MGVPFFCILLGLPVGWYCARKSSIDQPTLAVRLRKILRAALLTSGITMAAMALLWGPTLRLLFDSGFDLANFGIPMILYQPRASFIGWIVLMVVIAPFLQLLMTVFGAHLKLMQQGK